MDVAYFSEFCNLIRNDLLGVSQQNLPVKKMAKNFGMQDPSDLQDAIEALQYIILHIAKVNASEQEFLSLYDACGLNPDPNFKKAMYDSIFPHVQDIRQMLSKENDRFIAHYQDLEWRLSMVTATRARHNIMVPKYTLKFDLKAADESEQNVIMDADYNNLKRL